MSDMLVKGFGGREGQEGKEHLAISLMSGKARDEKITEPVERSSQDVNLACTGRNW